jgi:activator of 2-hydroxyglutaryl-CoA dehydratase
VAGLRKIDSLLRGPAKAGTPNSVSRYLIEYIKSVKFDYKSSIAKNKSKEFSPMAAAKNTKSSRKNGFPPFYLGVDGGGTKTHVAVLNDAREMVGEGAAGPSNPLRVGV